MPTVFRLTKRNRASSSFDREGARLFGGRWNSKGVRMVYTSQSLSLAILENLVHLDSEAILASKFAYREASLPNDLMKTLTRSDLPSDWDSDEIKIATQKIGDRWIRDQESAALAVPSVLSPDETNVLINPQHPNFQHVTIGAVQSFRFSPRLVKK